RVSQFPSAAVVPRSRVSPPITSSATKPAPVLLENNSPDIKGDKVAELTSGAIWPSDDSGSEIYTLPTSAAQRRFCVLEEFAPGNPALHMRACVRLSGSLSLAALEKSLQFLVDRHEILRTSFERVEEEIFQLIAPSIRIPLPVTSLESGGTGGEQLEARLMEAIRAEAIIPFDVSAGPLIRARLFRLSPNDHVLMITTHHIVVDG